MLSCESFCITDVAGQIKRFSFNKTSFFSVVAVIGQKCINLPLSPTEVSDTTFKEGNEDKFWTEKEEKRKLR